MKELIYYGSFLVFPCVWIIYLFRKKIPFFLYIWLWLTCLLFMYARFIEPQIILIKNTQIDVWFESKIALIWDIHLWKYKWKVFLDRLVKKLNELDVEYVLIAGDLTYEPEKWDLQELFWAFKNLKHETYWVLWNHDVERPWPNIRSELISVLDNEKLYFLNNDIVELNNFTLAWLGSNWNNEDDASILWQFNITDDIVVLMHNPDSLEKFPESISDLALAGHTHGWQIRIPILYKKVIPTLWSYDKWYTQEKKSKLFITSGLWEVWLPMRFLNPPVIDVINLK
jgi:predicted MPP superfamily phosphohydrolase